MRSLSMCSLLMLIVCGSCSTEPPQSAADSPADKSQNEITPTKKPADNDKSSSPRSAAKVERVASLPNVNLTTKEINDGWIQLFDGISLFGWKPNNDVNWSVEDGMIAADQGKPGLLLTTVPFADFELRCDFRLEKGGNSGVFLRSPFNPTDPAVDCYELNMCDTHPAFATASLVGRVKPDEPVNGDGEWRTYHVVCQGPHITVKMDGKTVLDFTDKVGASAPVSGLIGLQKNKGKIEFRNVFLKPLGAKPIFNEKDLAGWRVVPGSKSDFVVKDKTIHVTDGAGFLETEQTWSDFIFQFDAITNDKHLNSGVFFRAMRGSEDAPSHGYEAQIHNGFEDGDRTKPMDWGTGAIFRRQKARWVAADDQEWFTVTLAAHADHFAVWVNGLQVTDWADEREPNENPRRGKRLKAGHISLQGHDPTTNLAFRRLRIVAYPNQSELSRE